MKLNRTPNPLDRNARNGENDNWNIIEGETKKIKDKVDNFLDNVSEDAFNKIIDDIRLNWSHKVDNFADLPPNPKNGDTVAVENDDMIYRYDGNNWVGIIPFTQFSAIAEIENRLSSQLAETTQHNLNVLLIPDVHYSDISYGGMTPDDRAQFLVDCINGEHDKKPLDMVFFMGDLSSNNPPKSTEKLITEHLHKLKMPYFVLNGNHDLISDENWIKLLGYKKNYSFSFGGYAFLVLDTFANPVDPDESYFGQQYSKVDLDYFNSEIAKYEDKKVFVLCHHLNPSLDPEFTNLIYETPSIKAVFQGHMHDDGINLINGDGIPIINTGHFCYPRNESSGIEKAWGYRTLQVKNDEIVTEKILVEMNYPDFNQPYEVKDKIVLSESNKSMLTIKDSENLLLKNIFSKIAPIYDKTSNQLINTSGIEQYPDSGIINVFF